MYSLTGHRREAVTLLQRSTFAEEDAIDTNTDDACFRRLLLLLSDEDKQTVNRDLIGKKEDPLLTYMAGDMGFLTKDDQRP